MWILGLLLGAGADDPADSLSKKMLPIYLREAEAYSIAVETGPKTKKELEFKREPIFEWSNPTREGLQQGVIFLWLPDGRPSADVGRGPGDGGRRPGPGHAVAPPASALPGRAGLKGATALGLWTPVQRPSRLCCPFARSAV